MTDNSVRTTKPNRMPSGDSSHPASAIILRFLFRWLWRTVLGLAAALALTYLGDYAVFLMRGQPLGQVNVTRYMAAPLKDNKTEYYFEGSGPMACARALFPQSGSSPCWYLRRHPLSADKL